MLLILVFFIGYTVLNYIGSLVDGILNKALAQFAVGILVIVLHAIDGNLKE
jgi:hypothetical protein